MNLRAKVIVSTKKAETAEQIYSTIQCPTTSRRKDRDNVHVRLLRIL